MRSLKTSEAAAYLNVSPHTLRAWERRFGYPKPQRSEGQHRRYTYAEIDALRDALRDGLSVSSAISRAREGLHADVDSLAGALVAFDARRADEAMEATVALRDLDRAVEALLAATGDVLHRHGSDSAQWAFAWSWGCDWLARARRLASSPLSTASVLVGDTTAGDSDPESLQVRAFDLMCVRCGADVLRLSARGAGGISEAASARHVGAVVIAGDRIGDEAVTKWAAAALAGGDAPLLASYRRSERRRLRPASRMIALSEAPRAAAMELVELAAGRRAADTGSGSMMRASG
jgi:DNA-binding transcriptional MerR regulator